LGLMRPERAPLLVVVAVLGLLIVAVMVLTGSTVSPHIAMSPQKLRTGDSHTVNGSGFTPNGNVTLALMTDDGATCSQTNFQADASGRFNQSFTMQCGTNGFAIAVDGTTGRESNQVQFTVSGYAPICQECATKILQYCPDGTTWKRRVRCIEDMWREETQFCPGQHTGPWLSMEPTRLRQLDYFTLSGSGFTPNGQLIISQIDAGDLWIYDSFVADAEGRFIKQYQMRAYYGGYIYAIDQAAGGRESNRVYYTLLIGPLCQEATPSSGGIGRFHAREIIVSGNLRITKISLSLLLSSRCGWMAIDRGCGTTP